MTERWPTPNPLFTIAGQTTAGFEQARKWMDDPVTRIQGLLLFPITGIVTFFYYALSPTGLPVVAYGYARRYWFEYQSAILKAKDGDGFVALPILLTQLIVGVVLLALQILSLPAIIIAHLTVATHSKLNFSDVAPQFNGYDTGCKNCSKGDAKPMFMCVLCWRKTCGDCRPSLWKCECGPAEEEEPIQVA